MKFPAHKCGLFLSHNEHRDYYMKLEQFLAEMADNQPAWESPAHRQRAIDTDEYWELHWYPDTPIGSHKAAAPTLEELLDFVNKETI